MNNHEFFKMLDSNTSDVLMMGQQIPEPIPLYRTAQGWSGIEILEHICLTDQLVSSFIFGPPVGVATEEFLVGESRLRQLLVEDILPMDAPNLVRPRGTIKNVEQFAESFSGVRKTLKERLEVPIPLPDYRYYHTPLMGNLTVQDWLLFMIFHTERHLNQLRKLIGIT